MYTARMGKFHRQRKSFWIFDLIPVLGKLALIIAQSSSIHRVTAAHPAPGSLFSSSPSLLTELAQVDENIYKLMKEYRHNYYKRLEIMEKYINSYDETFHQVVTKANGSRAEAVDTESVRGNFEFQHSSRPHEDDDGTNNVGVTFVDKMKTRITIDIPHLISDIALHHEKDLMQKLIQMTPTEYPNLGDSKHLKDAIIKLHDVYNFDLAEFTEGKFFNFPTSIGLTGFQCYEIGTHAFGSQRYALAVEWLAIALDKIKRKSEKFVSLEIAADTLRIAVETHDKHWDLENISPFNPTGNYEANLTSASFFTNKILKNDEDVRSPIYRRTLMETISFKGNNEEKYNGINFRYLCSYRNFQTDNVKSQLYCWEESKSHPYWRINPQKMELLSQDPYIVQIYDFVHDTLATKMMEQAEPHLQRSMITEELLDALNDTSDSPKGKAWKGPGYRTSSVTWMDDSRDEDLVFLSKKIEMITGLHVVSPNASELLQVASYITGGHYAPHLDYIQDERLAKFLNGNNRVATFMVYLNQVELGGCTVFPTLGIAAMPIKGSAVFWYNMKADGTEADNRTWHGACPVIYGHKWAANKWIYFHKNIFNWKCPRIPPDSMNV